MYNFIFIIISLEILTIVIPYVTFNYFLLHINKKVWMGFSDNTNQKTKCQQIPKGRVSL